ncbi:hypothetical protein [Chitinilyticum piscinae]|uniref:Uncharacterized protein n=1 Tax=Chitinilyticum piscinae TaxID=2866724 RepID=A0A8J7FII8_9NEIS|nr:hypothetical protein [Chitinilyticum piscinae]MBE9610068.1 hypothetical protein [Chitinilyticum piscinae]
MDNPLWGNFPDLAIFRQREKLHGYSLEDMRPSLSQGLPYPPVFVSRFPRLAELLDRARVTDFVLDDQHKEIRLLAWTTHSGAWVCWTCCPPQDIALPDKDLLSPEQQLLLEVLGGIRLCPGIVNAGELDGSPADNFALNQDFVFFASDTPLDTLLWVEDYDDAFANQDDRGNDGETVQNYTRFADGSWLVLAHAADGGEVLCHRETGHLLVFSGSHCNPRLQPHPVYRWTARYNGQSTDYLLQIEGIASWHDWVEALATQWLVATQAGISPGQG